MTPPADSPIEGRQPPPPDAVVAVQQNYPDYADTVDELVARVRKLLARYPTDMHVVTDACLSLLSYEPSKTAMLGAIAIVRLAKQPP